MEKNKRIKKIKKIGKEEMIKLKIGDCGITNEGSQTFPDQFYSE